MKNDQRIDVVHMEDGGVAILKKQKEAFIEKFGREPGPSDPVFFDPACDTPTPITEERLTEMYHDSILETTSVFSKNDN